MSTVGWKTCKRHQIEIWFENVRAHTTLYQSEKKKRTRYRTFCITFIYIPRFRLGSEGKARILDAESENESATKISGLMKGKYGR